VDASLGVAHLCWPTCDGSKDWDFAANQKVQRGVQLLLDLGAAIPSFEGTPVLFVPGDCALS